MSGKRLVQLCSNFDSLSKRIMQETLPNEREWAKIKILCTSADYLAFLCHLTGTDESGVVSVLSDFGNDQRFKAEFGPKLTSFEASKDLVHGDVRFHSLTLYTIVRLIRPQWVVETGVASGKSSALILLALHHNGQGNLISIDLPNIPGCLLSDGALTHTGGRPTGWLVPEYLRSRWQLLLGDSRQLLPGVIGKLPALDVFFHDSLHTFDHVQFELETASKCLESGSVVLVDNVDLAGGAAFQEFLASKHLQGVAFRDLGGVRFPEGNGAA